MARKTTTPMKSLVAATLLALAALAPEAASAQEAIMLESIGAVRMAQPSEIEASSAQPQPATTAAIDPDRADHADNR